MLPFYEHKTSQYQINAGNEMNFPPHLHAGTEALYVYSGEIITQSGEIHTPVKAGELVVFFPNVVHSYVTTDPNTNFSMFIYRDRLCDELEKLLSGKYPAKSHFTKDEIPCEIKSVMAFLENAEENNETALIIRLYFELMWARLLPLMDLQKKNPDLPEDLMVSVLSFINENFSEEISLEGLAKKFGVSRYKISRLFTHSIKTGINEYVNTLRIERAKSLLNNSELSIIEVAFACGFESQQTFNRVFKEICGCTPKAFRNQASL